MKKVRILETIQDCGTPIWVKGELYIVVGGDQDVYYLTTEQTKNLAYSGDTYEDTICGIDIDSNKDIIQVLKEEE